ncbi:MAG: FAD-dependent thymidylate synthase [Desulfosarcinaceae bacterium]|nr:FAD-dependent thymidylate synthase [Desulfosarcinaceae bacterium]
MKIIDPYFDVLNLPDGAAVLTHIELAARTCYKSEDKITSDSAARLLRALLKSGHHSVFEHASASVRITCDRGISHEIVRHRLCAFSQESTRYANYAKEKFGQEITVINPFFWPVGSPAYQAWKVQMESAEAAYLNLIEGGASPQEARSVLPNSLKTEVVMTANLREWRHILKLRCAAASHPQIRQIMLPLLDRFHRAIPVIFDDLQREYQSDIEHFAATAPLGACS